MKSHLASISEQEQHQDMTRSEIKTCFAQASTFSDEEIEVAMSLIAIASFKKGEILLRAGEFCTKGYAVVSGCVRQYYVVDGEEKTTFFYTEGQSIFSPNTTTKSVPVKYYLSCVEETTLSIMTLENQLELYKKFPVLESMSRKALQEELHNYQEMLSAYITTNPEERYLNLLKYRPELLNRVPQYQLASYLGVTPESLSRIRKRIFLK